MILDGFTIAVLALMLMPFAAQAWADWQARVHRRSRHRR